MIKHSLKDDHIHLSIDKVDFSYRIPLKKLDNTMEWEIGEIKTKGIQFKNVSAWTLHLFTKNITEGKFIHQFKDIVQKNYPDNTIDWEATLLAVKIQNEYNWLISTNATAEKAISEKEIISNLKKKYKLD